MRAMPACCGAQRLQKGETMVKAVLWDFGGVITSSPFERFRDYEERHGLPKDFIRGLNATNPDTNAWAQFERSEVSLDTFNELFRAEALAKGYDVPGRDIIEMLYGQVRPEMKAALVKCKKHLKVGCITNNVSHENKGAGGKGWSVMVDNEAHAREVAEVMDMFDVVIESSLVGIRKPDPRIYQMACENLSVAPQDCVYLDDLGINLKPARALGMTTIKVVDPATALRELEVATGLCLSEQPGARV